VSVTVREKEQLLSRMSARVAELNAERDGGEPDWKAKLQREAAEQLAKDLSLEQELQQIERLREERRQNRAALVARFRALKAKFTGELPADVAVPEGYQMIRYLDDDADTSAMFGRYPEVLRPLVKSATEARLAALVERHPVGAEQARLAAILADLGDELMLAGSHAQIKALWERAKAAISGLERTRERELRAVRTDRARKRKEAANAASSSDTT
jgi:hypothetical protein